MCLLPLLFGEYVRLQLYHGKGAADEHLPLAGRECGGGALERVRSRCVRCIN